ncbi:hypothetical protein [Halocatena pleomorpha]|uniref:hypothetical protein n=1 Tax=Halocatena pleomorpha TaxID=1785090 RepID=UPI001C8A0AB4|nr:hypothetical protein [Halocatena pleomorpha]
MALFRWKRNLTTVLAYAGIEWVSETFGPFLIPPILFVGGGIGYGILLLLSRRGWSQFG